MNSNSNLQDKVQEIEKEDQVQKEGGMRLLKKNEKNPETNGKVVETKKYERTASTTCTQSSVSIKHYDQLLVDLRCPGCTMRLTTPIFLCASGHSVCRICRISLKQCSVCSKEMTDMRSFTLERLSSKFQFPCKNLRNGCTVRLPIELMKWHEEKCVFKKTSCFMGKVYHDCHWVGQESDWINHCMEFHSSKVLQKHETHELMWNYESLSNNAGPILAYYLIQNYGETFNLYQIHTAKESSLTFTVMIADYKGTTLEKEMHGSDLPRYSFEIEFYNKSDQRYLLLQRYPVHFEDSETLLDDGKCVKISLKDVQRFLDVEKNLTYRLRITCCKVKKDRWDQLLTQAKDQLRGDDKDNNFAFFDSLESDPAAFTDSDGFNSLELVNQERNNNNNDNSSNNSDLLNQILRREFPDPNVDETSRLIQKPPRRTSTEAANRMHQRTTVKFNETKNDSLETKNYHI